MNAVGLEIGRGVVRLRGRESVGGREDRSSLMEMEDLGVELDDGNLVVRRHGEGVCQSTGLKPGRARGVAIQTWRACWGELMLLRKSLSYGVGLGLIRT